MKLTRFPRLGVAGAWLVLVVLVGGCSGLTNAPVVFHDGGSDAAMLDGSGPAETGVAVDEAGTGESEGGSNSSVDAESADGNDAGFQTFDALGVDGQVGTRDGGIAAGETGDALGLPDARIFNDGGTGHGDVAVVADVAPGDDRVELVLDGPGEDAPTDGNIISGDAAHADVVPPDAAGSSLTVSAGINQTACAGWPVSIGSAALGGAPPYTYSWSATPACATCLSSATVAEPVATVDATTKFTVTARDSLGAVATSSVTITVDANVADAGLEAKINPGASVRIGTPSRPGYTYAWTCDRPTCGLSSTTVAQPTVSPTLSTQYTVTVSTLGGCTGSDSVMVWVNLPVSTSPADGELAYPDSASLVVQFGASVLASSIKTSAGAANTLTLRETVSGTAVAFTQVFNPTLQTITITPTGANYNATVGQYTLTLVGGAAGIISDDATWPQRLPNDVVVHFTIIVLPDGTGPTIVFRSPAQGATGVPPNTSVVVTFSEPLDPATATLSVSATGPASANLAGTLSYDPTTATLTFVPDADFANFATYTARLTGIKDLAGNTAAPPNWNFTTGRTPETTTPTVTAVSPAAGATKVLIGTSVEVTFSEPVAPATVADGFQLAAGTDLVVGSVTYDPVARVASFVPSSPLASQTLYTVTVTGVTDLAGNAMAAPFTSTFTTARVLFTDTFESGTTNWTWPATSTWGVTTDQFVSPTHSLTESPGGNYAPNLDISATSSVIDVTNVGAVSFSYWLSGQTQPSPGGDVLHVDYSINGGATWPNLANYSGTMDWAQHSHAITWPPGTTGLQVRFRFTSNANQQFDGVYIDDVLVQAQ